MAGLVSDITVTFHNLTHSTVNDIDALLVSPSGDSLVVLSDVGDPQSTFASAANATLTFSDAAAGAVQPGLIGSGSYKPTNYGEGDAFPAPAPSPSNGTTLSGEFDGTDPNGTWRLFIVDDTTGDVGSMAGGWSLSITTNPAAVATTTSLTTSGTTSTTGSPVTFTATVSAGGNPVTSGSVEFRDGATTLGSSVPVNGAGRASFTTSSLPEGTHAIRANYLGSTEFLASTGTLTQQVDNTTVVNGNTFCNTGAITIPAIAQATPYPSHITVSGLSGPISKVTATLKGLSHQVVADVDVMLSGPTPTDNVTLLSDVGGSSAASGVDVTFDDDAAGGVPTPVVSGTYRPTDDDTTGADTFPAPAPSQGSATTLGTFDAKSPNGTWSLWVIDDASGDTGQIASGWCLTVETAGPATTTALASDLNPSTIGTAVTFTATVTSVGAPVSSGSVQFSDGPTLLGTPVPVAVDGTATLTTSSLAIGTHPILAEYSGAGFADSSASLDQVVNNVAAHLTLVKTVTNDNGGGAFPTAWTLSADGPTPITGATGSDGVTNAAVDAGSYVLAESGGPAGYTAGAWGCTGGTLTGSTLEVERGTSVTCTINNNDQPADLTLVKRVTNDNRGTALSTAWTLSASGPTPISGATGSTGVTHAVVNAGTYALAESGGPAGYTAGAWGCTGGTVTGSTVKVGSGASVTCTINNNDQPAHLTLVKKVINNSGGTARPTAWILSASGPSRIRGATGGTAVTNAVVPSGRYTLTESGPSGYTASAWSCVGATYSQGVLKLTPGVSAVCTITNNDKPAHLTLVKKVINDNGGTARATAWTLSAQGPARIRGATGSTAVTRAVVPAGHYTLAESGPTGYTASAWYCLGAVVSSGVAAVLPGANVVCTITNNDRRRR